MINPYATSFMIAARQDYYIRPRLTASPSHKPGTRLVRLFSRKSS